MVNKVEGRELYIVISKDGMYLFLSLFYLCRDLFFICFRFILCIIELSVF